MFNPDQQCDSQYLMGMLLGAALVLAFTNCGLSGKKSPGLCARLGLQSGWRSAIIGGGICSVFAMLNALEAIDSNSEMLMKSHMWLTWVVSLTAIFPSALAGFIGGLIGFKVFGAHGPIGLSSPLIMDPAKRQKAIKGIMILSYLGLASPLIFLVKAPKVDPSPVFASAPTVSNLLPNFQFKRTAKAAHFSPSGHPWVSRWDWRN